MSIRLFFEQSITRSYPFSSWWKNGISVVICILFTPFSWLYSLVVSSRNTLYDLGWLKPKILPSQVISVGNITVGGTGKTPHVVYLAKFLDQKGFRVAVLAAGYRSKSNKQVVVVSDDTPVSVCGDEALMIYRQLTADQSQKSRNVPVLSCRNRYKSGLQAVSQFGSEVLIVDDGFQHRQLERMIDIVLIKSENQLAPKLLPAGAFREPLSSLGRADIIIQSSPTKLESADNLDINQPVFNSYYRATRLYPIQEPNRQIGIDEISGARVFAFCGIGNPSGFSKLLQSLDPADLKLMIFSDHHQYDMTDLQKIHQASVSLGADLIVTTEKDQPKITSWSNQPNIYVISVEPVIPEAFGLLVDTILRREIDEIKTSIE